ncbi:hypothetical protein [Ureibacillus sinduriensis]|uniref:hypothetical protein n=1 Tax=Ureibacillus sinduriensis TaxID=561440 RepID=UPI00068F01B0|nr:hypothetical protein [Ureibacillus sinduriensis]
MTIDEHIIANDVLRNVMDKFKNQQVKGLAKYGETVNPESYDVVGWLNHMQQEMIDGVVYAEVLIGVTSKIVEENKRLRKALEDIDKQTSYFWMNKNEQINQANETAKIALEESK